MCENLTGIFWLVVPLYLKSTRIGVKQFIVYQMT
jgi:hypothetical protein